GLLVKAGNARCTGVRQNAGPALDDRVPVLQHGPPRVEAGDRGPSRPERVHGSEVTRGKCSVEFEIRREHGILVGHCNPRYARRDDTLMARISPADRKLAHNLGIGLPAAPIWFRPPILASILLDSALPATWPRRDISAGRHNGGVQYLAGGDRRRRH